MLDSDASSAMLLVYCTPEMAISLCAAAAAAAVGGVLEEPPTGGNRAGSESSPMSVSRQYWR